MKSLVIFLVVAASIILVVRSDPEWKIELLEPEGFRLSMENIEGLLNATTGIDIFKEPFKDVPDEDYEGQLTQQSDGWWTFEMLNSTLSQGDKMFVVIANFIENHDAFDLLGDMIIETYTVPSNATRIPV